MWRGTKIEGKVLHSVLHLLSFRFFSKCRSKESTWLERYSMPGLMGLKARLSMMCSRHAAQRMRLARRLNDSRWRRRDRGLYSGREHLVTWGFFSRIWEEPSPHPRLFCLRDLFGDSYRRSSHISVSQVEDLVVVFISKCPVRLKWFYITCYVCHGSDMTCRLGLWDFSCPRSIIQNWLWVCLYALEVILPNILFWHVIFHQRGLWNHRFNGESSVRCAISRNIYIYTNWHFTSYFPTLQKWQMWDNLWEESSATQLWQRPELLPLRL